MVFNTTFNNISVISWWSVLLVEETAVPGENLPQVTYKFYQIMLYILVPSTPGPSRIQTQSVRGNRP